MTVGLVAISAALQSLTVTAYTGNNAHFGSELPFHFILSLGVERSSIEE